MKNDLLKAIEEYREKHPEINDIMKKFQMTLENYNEALASIGGIVKRINKKWSANSETALKRGERNENW